MDQELDLVLTLAGALGAALLLGLIAHRLRLSPIVGYLLAGVAVGPFTPGFVAHRALATQFAELGVVLLMFGVGLNLRTEELLRVRRVAVPGAIAAMAAAACGGFVVARALGWSARSAGVFGLAICVTSTVVLLRIFADRGLSNSQAGHVAVGWLLVEDLFVVLAAVLLPLFASTSPMVSPLRLAGTVVLALAKVVGLVALTLLVGRRAIPRLLALIAGTRSRELFTLAVLVVALGLAVGAARLFGASVALGAFLAGLVVGQSDFGSRAGSEALPMRDASAVLFFVATGMLLDPSQVLPNMRLTLATLAVVLVAKPSVALATMLLLRYPTKTASAVALGLGQIGEFSFLLAGVGGSLGLLPIEAAQALVSASMIAIAINPLLLGLLGPLSRGLDRVLSPRPEAAPCAETTAPAYRVIVVGYGPVGRSLVRLLLESGVVPTVVELNHETVASIRAQGLAVVYGDASRREILERAGVSVAAGLIFTASAPSEPTIRAAKELNPEVFVLARATYLSEAGALRKAGANEVVSEEGEVALAMVESLLKTLGATEEQLDGTRERVRHELAELSGVLR